MGIKLDYLFCVFIVTVVSMVLHELAHGVVALWQGDETARENGRLSLNPLKHIDPVMTILVPLILSIMGMPIFGGAKPVPVNKYRMRHGHWSMALVALAGPLTNIVLAMLFCLISCWCGLADIRNGILYTVGGFAGSLISAGVYVNLGFALFNLLPIPPLDGSRIFYVIMPDGVRGIMDMLEQYGTVIVYVLICLFGSLLSVYMSAGRGILINFFALFC